MRACNPTTDHNGQGRVPPPLKDRREWILTNLREERVSEEIDRWLPTARQKAEIVTVAEP
ncbi:MAG TPA: hypothetical protein VFV34_06550 [Blastocatellia bacterium]|nr:hypothetical protein [Blastocatellia bacterium]